MHNLANGQLAKVRAKTLRLNSAEGIIVRRVIAHLHVGYCGSSVAQA